jgi:hypothetical protein
LIEGKWSLGIELGVSHTGAPVIAFSKIKLDGGSIMAMMGSTSEKMYLCLVPDFGVLNDKAETGRVTCTRRESQCSVSV